MAKKSVAGSSSTKAKAVNTESPNAASAPETDAVAANTSQESSHASLLPKEPTPKVNNASLSELKNACDDLVKEFYARPGAFTRSHVHEDVRLVLGWSAVAIALATGYHGYVNSFDESKKLVTVGVVLYMILSTAMTIYITYYEQSIIFEGKRRTFASRISTERLTVSSTAAASARHSTGSLPFPFSLLAPRVPASATSKVVSAYPSYTLNLNYTHSSNNGKSLIHQANATSTKCFGDFFDAEGRMCGSALEAELARLLSEVVGK